MPALSGRTEDEFEVKYNWYWRLNISLVPYQLLLILKYLIKVLKILKFFVSPEFFYSYMQNPKLEDLRPSPDLFNHVKIGQGQLRLIIKHILFYHIWGCSHFGQVT